MGITVAWDNGDRTIIRLRFRATWTWQDLHAALDKARRLQAQVDHTVDLILDMRDSPMVPGGAIAQFRQFANLQAPSNTGLRVVVARSPIIVGLYEVFIRIAKKSSAEYQLVRTLDEAYAKVAEMRLQRESL